MRRSYFFWYFAFRLALIVEAQAVRLRDLAQRRKMACVPQVPGFWSDWEGGGW
jgi:hypothetical protein